MKCMVLAAGYATRLYPLTENFPKPLLDIQGKSILDWLLQDVDVNIDVDEYIIVSNHKFIEHFQKWQQSCKLKHPVSVLDDGSTANENRLGAVKDIMYAIEQLHIDDDLMVLAGDNVLDFSLKGFADFFKEKSATCVMRYFEPEESKLRRTGVAEVSEDAKIISMEEKPREPKSNWAIPPFYIYKREDLQVIRRGIEDGCETDAPGSFIAWLCGQCDVYAYEMPGKRYDIGDLKSYQMVQETFQGIKEWQSKEEEQG